MSGLFTRLDVPPWELIARTVAIYFIVIVFLRVAGKRQMGQMGPTEFVAVLLLSNAVQNAMTGGDNSLSGGVISAGILVLASWFLSWATFKSPGMRTIFRGTPIVLVQKGQIIQSALDQELLTKGDLIKMLRQQGVDRIEDAYLAVLDSEGSLSVARQPPEAPPPSAT
jgi:uncharacterized membrane protein YcaP (DUF421 family)